MFLKLATLCSIDDAAQGAVWVPMSQKILNMNSACSAYLIVLLQSVFSSWEWLFSLFAAFAWADLRFGGMLSASLFLSGAVIRAIFSHSLAKIAERSPPTTRLRLSLAARSIFLCGFFAIPALHEHPFSIILWSLIANVLLVFDSYAALHLRYHFSDAKHVSLIRLGTLNNLGRRGSVAFASIIAFQIGKNNWVALSHICVWLAASGVMAAIVSILYAGKHAVVTNEKAGLAEDCASSKALHGIATMAAAFLFLMNLFFSASSLLFTRAIAEYGLSYDSVNLLTFFYFGFIVLNVLVVLFDQRMDAQAGWKGLVGLYIAIAVISSLFFPLRHHFFPCAILATMSGVVYGWSIVIFFPLVSKRLRGDHQAVLNAKIDSIGRFGFILAQVLTGALLDASFDPLQLLQQYAVLSLVVLTGVLFICRKRFQEVAAYDYSIA